MMKTAPTEKELKDVTRGLVKSALHWLGRAVDSFTSRDQEFDLTILYSAISFEGFAKSLVFHLQWEQAFSNVAEAKFEKLKSGEAHTVAGGGVQGVVSIEHGNFRKEQMECRRRHGAEVLGNGAGVLGNGAGVFGNGAGVLGNDAGVPALGTNGSSADTPQGCAVSLCASGGLQSNAFKGSTLTACFLTPESQKARTPVVIPAVLAHPPGCGWIGTPTGGDRCVPCSLRATIPPNRFRKMNGLMPADECHSRHLCGDPPCGRFPA